jgi:hypothetical protein
MILNNIIITNVQMETQICAYDYKQFMYNVQDLLDILRNKYF